MCDPRGLRRAGGRNNLEPRSPVLGRLFRHQNAPSLPVRSHMVAVVLAPLVTGLVLAPRYPHRSLSRPLPAFFPAVHPPVVAVRAQVKQSQTPRTTHLPNDNLVPRVVFLPPVAGRAMMHVFSPDN